MPLPRSLVVKKGSTARSATSGDMPGPVSGHPHGDVIRVVTFRAQPFATGPARDRQHAALGHGVARIQGQVQDRQFELVGIGQRPCARAPDNRAGISI